MLHEDRLVLHGFARAIIRRKALLIARCDGFTEKDLEDIEQELRLFLVKSLDQYDPGQGHINVFMTTVIERAKAMMVRDRWRKKRNSTGICSIHSLSSKRHFARPNLSADRFDLEQDLSDVLASLPAELRDLAERLQQQTIAQAAREMNVPRGTLMRRIEQLRRHFENAGLRDYL